MLRNLSIILVITFAAMGRYYAGVAEDVKALTGEHTRVVWCQQQSGYADFRGQSADFTLQGLDTDDGNGIRTILSAVTSYARPLLTADGSRVVYSDWTDGMVYVVNFDGTGKKSVVSGFCSDVWCDPGTGTDYGYIRQGGTSGSLYKIALDTPSDKTLVWSNTDLGNEHWVWFQVSDDGTRGAGTFPWSTGGMAVLPNTSWSQFGSGCWTSMSPDNNYNMWIFQDSHREVVIYDKNGTAKSTVTLNSASGIRGWEVYHPKWSNQAGFVTMTGPYSSGSTSSCTSGDCGNNIADGGTNVELYIGKMNSGLTAMEGWVKITADTKADFFGDAWIDTEQEPQPELNLSPTTLEFAATAGGTDPAAQTVTATAVDGLDLSGITADESASWLSVGISGSGTSRTLTNNVNISGLSAGTVQTTVTVIADGETGQYTVTLTLAAPVDSGSVSIKINAGGATLSGWTDDGPYVSGGDDYATTEAIITSGVANAAPAELYQTCRNLEPQFAFTLPADTYTVRLHFAEPYWTTVAEAAEKRKMNVAIEGTTVLSDFSPATAAGACFTAYVWEDDITVSDGTLNIAFDKGTGGDAFVMGIEVVTAQSTALHNTAVRPAAVSAGTVRWYTLTGSAVRAPGPCGIYLKVTPDGIIKKVRMIQ